MNRNELVSEILNFALEEDQAHGSRCNKAIRNTLAKKRFVPISKLHITSDNPEEYTCKLKTMSGHSVFNNFSHSQLHQLEVYNPYETKIVGSSNLCRRFIEDCPVIWFNSLMKVEIHITDEDPSTSRFWKAKIKSLISQMESLSNIIVSDSCFGTKSIIKNHRYDFSWDANRKSCMVFAKFLNPTTAEDVIEIRQEAKITNEFFIVSNGKFNIYNDLKNWLTNLGAQEAALPGRHFMIYEMDNDNLIYLFDYEEGRPMIEILLAFLAVTISIIIVGFCAMSPLETLSIASMLVLFINLPMLHAVWRDWHTAVYYKSYL